MSNGIYTEFDTDASALAEFVRENEPGLHKLREARYAFKGMVDRSGEYNEAVVALVTVPKGAYVVIPEGEAGRSGRKIRTDKIQVEKLCSGGSGDGYDGRASSPVYYTPGSYYEEGESYESELNCEPGFQCARGLHVSATFEQAEIWSRFGCT